MEVLYTSVAQTPEGAAAHVSVQQELLWRPPTDAHRQATRFQETRDGRAESFYGLPSMQFSADSYWVKNLALWVGQFL